MSTFDDRLTSVMEKQFQVYEPYQTLCDMEGVAWPDIKAMIESGDLHAIPAIPADWFKQKKRQGAF